MRLFQSEERVEEGEELAWRGVLWHGVPHGMEGGGGVRREDGSIALIFHDLSHSPLAFRERSTYEGGEGEEAARPPLAKQASATQSIKGVP